MRFDLGPSLPALKLALQTKIDIDAEVCRLRFLSAGAGQALEYQATEQEARAFVLAGMPEPVDPATYPFLVAEMQAQQGATGVAPTVEQLVALTIGQADAWRYVGSEIKRLRRSAKISVELATTPAAARAAAAVNWPTP